jgi:hypothetical protein
MKSTLWQTKYRGNLTQTSRLEEVLILGAGLRRQQYFLQKGVGLTYILPHDFLRVLECLIRISFTMLIGASAFSACATVGDNEPFAVKSLSVNESRLRPGECQQFEVDSTNPWNVSQISVRKGEDYRISVAEVIPPWKDDWVGSTPEEGWSGLGKYLGFIVKFWARSPGLPMYALVCSEDGTEKSAWAIGMGVLRKIRVDSGSIACFANDWSGRYSNNHGSAIIKICREVSDYGE